MSLEKKVKQDRHKREKELKKEQEVRELSSKAQSFLEDHGVPRYDPGAELDFGSLVGIDEKRKRELLAPIISETEYVESESSSRNGYDIVSYIGPSGTGKTYTAKALAGELDIPVTVFRPEKIMNYLVGKSEEAFISELESLRKKALDNDSPAMLIADDMEILVRKKEQSFQSKNGYEDIIPLLLQISGGGIRAERYSDLIVLLTINRPRVVDRAILSRSSIVRFDLPDQSTVKKLLLFHLVAKGVPTDFDIDWNSLAGMMVRKDFTHRDVKRTASKAKVKAVFRAGGKSDKLSELITERKIDEEKYRVLRSDIEEAVKEIENEKEASKLWKEKNEEKDDSYIYG